MAVIDAISLNEAIPAAEAIQMLRRWNAHGLNSAQIINVMNQLKPAQVLHLAEIAERKIARRNRPR